jgi:ubiquinone/menaquinone biosynthesis C-methylase UbiE
VKMAVRGDTQVQTSGHVLNWYGPVYDFVANVMTLGRLPRMREEILSLAGIRSGDQMLDVGCGTGSLAILAAKRVDGGGRVCGIDPAPRMIAAAMGKAARQNVMVDFRPGAIEALPFPDQSFDLVVSSFMLHHLPDDVKRKGFTEVRRVLRPGGRFLAVDLQLHRFSVHNVIARLFGSHPERHVGIMDLWPLLEEAGFRDTRSGPTSFRSVSFVEAANR